MPGVDVKYAVCQWEHSSLCLADQRSTSAEIAAVWARRGGRPEHGHKRKTWRTFRFHFGFTVVASPHDLPANTATRCRWRRNLLTRSIHVTHLCQTCVIRFLTFRGGSGCFFWCVCVRVSLRMQPIFEEQRGTQDKFCWNAHFKQPTSWITKMFPGFLWKR
jgi:hypothetical protein